MMESKNPYIAGNPVGGSDAFIGRTDVLREVLRTLRHPYENALLLYGQRRIGKTSVLQELKKQLPTEGAYLPVYFDLQDKARLSVDRLLQDLARHIIQDLDIDVPELAKDNAEEAFHYIFLPKVMEQFPSESKIVLLLDEFDVLDSSDRGQAGERFFPYLRTLLSSTSHQLQFIFVIGRRPDDLTNIINSVFKGTRSHSVSLLSEADTEALVRLSERNQSLLWNAETVAQVYGLVGGHPLLTQQLCQEIWEEHYQSEENYPQTVDLEVVRASVSTALKAARQALEWLWDGLKPAEKLVAAALAEAGSGVISQEAMERLLQESGIRIVLGELQNAPSVLREWDLIREEEGGFQFRVEILRQWIAAQKPLSRVQEEIDRINPVAESLFSAASQAYRNDQFNKAESRLKEAVGENPNHVRARQMLGDIFVRQERFVEARQILEELHAYNPAAAKPKLTQVLLSLVKDVQAEEQRLALYEQVLGIDPNHIEARAKYQQIWVARADVALEQYKNNAKFISVESIEETLEVLMNADLGEDAKTTEQELRKEYIKRRRREVLMLEKEYQYKEALTIAERLHSAYAVDESISSSLESLRKKVVLPEMYEKAQRAIEKKDHPTAQDILVEIARIEPQYRDTIRHLYIIVNGTDPIELSAKLEHQDQEIKNAHDMQNQMFKKQLTGMENVRQELSDRIKVLESENRQLSIEVDSARSLLERITTAKNDVGRSLQQKRRDKNKRARQQAIRNYDAGSLLTFLKIAVFMLFLVSLLSKLISLFTK